MNKIFICNNKIKCKEDCFHRYIHGSIDTDRCDRLHCQLGGICIDVAGLLIVTEENEGG